jgi:hypothetical protein
MPPKTLTEAHAAGGIIEIYQGANATYLSNAREVPYAEIYRDRSGVIETPVQRLQRAGQDEARRLEHRRAGIQ